MGRVKCLVTDLDDTLWNGKLISEGVDGIKPFKERIEVLRELDKRGILLSIASRNNKEPALKVLNEFGIYDLFLVPQISWGPKYVSLEVIASTLNLGLNSFAFVDDTPDELAEMSNQYPEVMTIRAEDYLKIPSLPRFEGGATIESRNRRVKYQGILKERKMQQRAMIPITGLETKVRIRLAKKGDFERIGEMLKGNHKLNFSGNIYDLDTLEKIFEDPNEDIYVVNVQTSETDHGRAGVCIIDKSKDYWYAQDFLFSCTVIGKGVEVAVLGYLLEKANQEGIGTIKLFYHPTAENKQLPLFLNALDYSTEKIGQNMLYRFDTSQSTPNLINIKVENG